MASAPFPWLTPLTPWQRFRREPAVFLAQWLYKRRRHPTSSSPTPNSASTISVVCISDTHCRQPDVPDGDILLHAGDLTNKGSFEEIQSQLHWLRTLPHRYKVVIAGNHDFLLDPDYVARFPDRIYEGEGSSRADLDWGDVIYLNNSSARLDFPGGRSLSVYGSPWTEQFGTWAFQYPPIRDVWTDSVPAGTDILLTHGPPKGRLDLQGKGCPHLLREIWRRRPRLVVFGHIHAGHGRQDIAYDAVEAAYDGVVMGQRGLWAVLVMAPYLVLDWLWDALLLPRRRGTPAQTSTLVNAAVAGDDSRDKRSAIVVDL